MNRALIFAIVLGLVGCYQRYYVADVHQSGSGLAMTKCALDSRGTATSWCHEEDVEDTDGEFKRAPDPTEIERVKRELDRDRVVARSAPTDEEITKAVTASAVHKLIELCRDTYATDVTTLKFGITVAPTGEITIDQQTGNARFDDCAGRALRTANIPPYEGERVHSEQQLTLSLYARDSALAGLK